MAVLAYELANKLTNKSVGRKRMSNKKILLSDNDETPVDYNCLNDEAKKFIDELVPKFSGYSIAQCQTLCKALLNKIEFEPLIYKN